jgi:hypothetical protein
MLKENGSEGNPRAFRATAVKVVIGTGIAAFLVIQFIIANARVAEYAKIQTYARVDAWLESARCAAKTGTFLTTCPNGRIMPVEDVAADDRGHTLLLNLWSLLTRREPTREGLVRLNFGLNTIGFLALSASLAALGLRIPGLLCAFLLGVYGVPGLRPNADVTAAFPGIVTLALCPSLVLIQLLRNRIRESWARGMAVVGGAAAAALAMLLRESIGTLGVLTFLLVATSWWTLANRAAFRSTWILVFEVPPASGIAGHGFSHNLYLGLGVYPNPWGIRWDDAVGEETAKRVKPDVRYCSPEYYRILLQEYWRILRFHAPDVLQIYAHKFRVIMGYHWARVSPVPYALMIPTLMLLGGLWIVARRRGGDMDVFPALALALMWGGLVLQGILAHPAYFFVYPAEILQILLLAILLEWARLWTVRLPAPSRSDHWRRVSNSGGPEEHNE